MGDSLKTLRVSAGKATAQKTGRESREVPGTMRACQGSTCPAGHVPEGTETQDTQSPGGGKVGWWEGVPPHHWGGRCEPGGQLCTCDQRLQELRKPLQAPGSPASHPVSVVRGTAVIFIPSIYTKETQITNRK